MCCITVVLFRLLFIQKRNLRSSVMSFTMVGCRPRCRTALWLMRTIMLLYNVHSLSVVVWFMDGGVSCFVDGNIIVDIAHIHCCPELVLVFCNHFSIIHTLTCSVRILVEQLISVNVYHFLCIKRRLRFAGLCVRHRGVEVSNLVLWEPTQGKFNRRSQRLTYMDRLRKDTGLQTTAELKTLMKDKCVWRAICLLFTSDAADE